MKKPDSKFTTLRFVFIAVVLMLLADTYLFGGKRSYIEEAKQSYREETLSPISSRPERSAVEGSEDVEETEDPSASLGMTEEGNGMTEGGAAKGDGVPEEKVAPVVVEPEDGAAFFEAEPEAALPPVTLPGPFEGKAKVAIIIDDLGMDVKRSRQIVDLPAPITLAFLPYGTKTVELAKIGKARGHELIIHTPMQAVDTTQNIGPMGLKANMDQATFDSSFKAILQSFDGYDGINNHMGSLLTQDEAAMTRLMGHLKANNLFFVDSKTIGGSVAAREAREAGVPYAVRDVFLDHENSRAFVDRALLQLERKALRDGSAIAIGHPKDVTIAGLRAWMPTLAAKGIEIVPVKELLVRPVGEAVLPSAKADGVVDPRCADLPDGKCHGDDNSVVSSRPERSGVEGTQNGVEAGDPSRSLRMTEEGNGMTEPEIAPEVPNAFDGAIAQPVPPLQPPPTQLPAIY